MTNFCEKCHFESDYMHSHQELSSHFELDKDKPEEIRDKDDNFVKIVYPKKEVFEWIKINDGIWTDQSKMCLPCSTMWKI